MSFSLIYTSEKWKPGFYYYALQALPCLVLEEISVFWIVQMP